MECMEGKKSHMSWKGCLKEGIYPLFPDPAICTQTPTPTPHSHPYLPFSFYLPFS